MQVTTPRPVCPGNEFVLAWDLLTPGLTGRSAPLSPGYVVSGAYRTPVDA